MNKKIISAFLVIIFVFSSLGTGVFTLPAAGVTSGDFTYSITGDKVYITGYVGTSQTITIPSSIDEKEVYGIADEAFAGKNFIALTVSEGIQLLGNYAFEACRFLKTITLPSTITYIGTLCFNQNASLESIIIPKSVSYLGSYVFRDCIALKTVSVDSENSNFKSVDNVIYSKDGKILVVYPSALAASAYTVLDGTETIGKTSFVANKLTSIQLPDSLIKISTNAFSESPNLTYIKIPENTQIIGERAFSTCTALARIDIPASVELIDRSAFNNKNKELKIHGNNYSYAELFAATNSIEFVSSGSFQSAIEAVVEKIETLNDITLEKKQDVENARIAYDALTYLTVKSYVTNYQKLLMAEKTIEALENNEPIPEYKLGDVDNDGFITVSDVVALRSLIMKSVFNDREKWASDINLDNSVTVSDVVALRSMIMKGAG